jgi:predicted AAA+ superfamily ATPase
MALSEVFGRISGDMSVPAVHRLETAFGGGKTHTLIACTHIAQQGTKLKKYHERNPEPSFAA